MTNVMPLSARVPAPETLPELPADVGGTSLTWRPATRADLDGIHALVSAAGLVDHPQDLIERDGIEAGFDADPFDPRTDTVIGFAANGEPIAYAEARAADTAETEVEVSLDGVVHPGYRGLGIGRALLAWQEARGRQLLASSDSSLPAMLCVGSREECTANLALYAAAGFAPVRWWLTLKRDLSAPIPDRALPEGLSVVPFTDRLSEATRIAFNDAFRDHWGSQPVSRREWEKSTRLGEFSAELSRLIVTGAGDGKDPHRVVAFALTEINEGEWEPNGGPFGYLEGIGVIRERRGQGLSSAVIAEALRGYRDRGLVSAILDVDSENPSGALGMYERLGFRPTDRSVTYAKRF
ncbi:GNAT family N-acetyltransferase [Microbacterium sp.]|uniref:GNAT family N-acetyltransferase n=1 Tax=Microbacterium sp. TaxID=51671 RepID=UPI00333F35D3